MRKSDVFDSFVKIAEEKGLLSEASPEENKEVLERTRRADSLTIAEIAKLYGIKPPAPPDAEYKKNIMERAHPDPVIIAPSYDKLNGLVENNNERQNILLHIVNKQSPDGQLTQRKYARKKLLMSLVKIGNEMDNRCQNDLRKLSDVCLQQASNPTLKKQAIIPIIIGIAAVVGVLYAQQHLPDHIQGLKLDFDRLISELDDFINSSTGWGFGTSYTEGFVNKVKDIKNKATELLFAAQKLLPILDQIQTPRTGAELASLQHTEQAQTAVSALEEFKTIWQNLSSYFKAVTTEFQSEQYKIRQVKDKGFFQKMVDSTNVLHGGWGLFSDDFDDVVRALTTFIKDVESIQKELVSSTKAEVDAQSKLDQASNSGNSAPSTPEKTPVQLTPIDQHTKTLQQRLEEESDLFSQ